MLRKLTVASMLPVSVARAKERLNIDAEDWDADIEALIKAAAGAVEAHIGRVLALSSWELQLDGWPGSDPIYIPVAPVREVTEIVYLAETTGVETVVAVPNWYWDRTPEGADVRFIGDYSFPTLYERPGSLRVRFDAGYDEPGEPVSGDDPELAIDPRDELAVLFLVGTWFANREHVNIGNITTELPDTFKFLVSQRRIFR